MRSQGFLAARRKGGAQRSSMPNTNMKITAIAKATYAKTLRKDDWPDQLA